MLHAHIRILVIMAPFVLLLVFTGAFAIVIAEGNSSHSCPLWHYRHNGECKCGHSTYGAIICSKDQVYLRVDHVMDVWHNVTVVAKSRYGHHNYSAIPKHLRVYTPIPQDTPQQDLNYLMCKSNNRKGFLCGECLPNYGPSAYSAKCHRCDRSVVSAVALYLTVKLVPVGILFILITTFRINVTKGPLLGYIFFCQAHVIVVRQMPAFYKTVALQVNALGATILLFLSAVWSLDFLPVIRFIPPFCISHKLRDSDVLLLDFVSALSPLFLLVMSCIFIELHARGFKVIVYCWKPFHHFFVRIRRNWSSSDSIIHAFASLMFLSFTSLSYNSYQLLGSTNVHIANSSHPLKTHVTINAPNIPMYTPKYIYYPVITLFFLIFLGVLPSLLLLLYPIRMFRVRLQRCCSQRLLITLNTFVETFQGSFKDGTNGTRDFRIIPGVFSCGILLLTALACLAHNNHYGNYLVPIYAMCLALLSVLIAYIKPCKSSAANLSLTFHFMLMAGISTLITLWRQDFNMSASVLASLLASFTLVPHVLMFLWVCYIIQKRFHLRQRIVTWISFMMGRVNFRTVKLMQYTPELPDRLLNSQEYRELT